MTKKKAGAEAAEELSPEMKLKKAFEAILEKGKAKGSLKNSEIMELLEDVEYESEQLEKLSKETGIKFTLTLSLAEEDACDCIKKYL